MRSVPFEEPKTKAMGKKAALSYGIDLASHDILLLTDADCLPGSEQWIELMAAPLLGNQTRCKLSSCLQCTGIAQQPGIPPLPTLAGVTLNVDRLVHVAQASSRWRQPAGLPPGGKAGVAGHQCWHGLSACCLPCVLACAVPYTELHNYLHLARIRV